MAKTKISTADLVGISNFSRNGLQTYNNGELVYFIVQPTNISVLSDFEPPPPSKNAVFYLFLKYNIALL